MKRKQESLGAILRKQLEDAKNLRIAQYIDSAKEKVPTRPTIEMTAEDVASVEALFATAQSFITKCISEHLTATAFDLPFGVGGLQSGVLEERERAIKLLEHECWPLTIGEGLRRRSNKFHRCWKAMCDWADDEELVLKFSASHSGLVASTDYVLRVSPRETWLAA